MEEVGPVNCGRYGLDSCPLWGISSACLSLCRTESACAVPLTCSSLISPFAFSPGHYSSLFCPSCVVRSVVRSSGEHFFFLLRCVEVPSLLLSPALFPCLSSRQQSVARGRLRRYLFLPLRTILFVFFLPVYLLLLLSPSLLLWDPYLLTMAVDCCRLSPTIALAGLEGVTLNQRESRSLPVHVWRQFG